VGSGNVVPVWLRRFDKPVTDEWVATAMAGPQASRWISKPAPFGLAK